jgi:hypothetical protein
LSGLERDYSSFLLLPSTVPFGQGYNTVGWLSHGSILLFAGSGDRDDVAFDQAAEIVQTTTAVAAPEERKQQAVQPSPPLTLPAAGQVGMPTPGTAAGGYHKQNLENGRTYSAKKAAGAETDNAAAVGAAKAAQIHRFSTTGEIGEDKAVPPQTGTAARTAARLLPGEKSAKLGNILDVCGNEKYQ